MPPSSGPYADPTMPDQRQWLNSDPTAGFWAYLRDSGLNQLDPVSKFAQSQYQSVQNQYHADAASDPNMGFYDYLQGKGFDFRGQYENQSPEQRGDFSNRTGAARARWVTPR